MQAGVNGDGGGAIRGRGTSLFDRRPSLLTNTPAKHVMLSQAIDPPASPLSAAPGATEQPPPPAAGRRRTTVSLHSLADAALADASHRPQHTRRSSITLPPISSLLPAASAPVPASKSSAQKLPSRNQATSGQPSVKGWSPATLSPKNTGAPVMLPRTRAVYRPIEVSTTPA